MEQFKVETIGHRDFVTYTLSTEEILDQVTLRMMNNNKIKGLVPMRFLQMDEVQMLRYDISGMKSLECYLENRVSSNKIVRLLKNLAESLINAREYMIEESSFVFERKYIYFGKDEEGQILCLPVEERQGDSFQEFCRQLINCPKVSAGLKDSSLFMINRYLYGTEFSIKEFSLLLEKAELESAISFSDREKSSENKDLESKIILRGDERIFPNKDGKGSDFESSGGRKTVVLDRNTLKETDNSSKTVCLLSGESRKQHILSDTDRTMYMNSANENCPDQSLVEEATVYFNFNSNNFAKGYLIRESTYEKIEINKNEFRIGKSMRDIDYQIDNNPTISRRHAKIIRRGNDFWLIDTESKNHTYIDKKIIESNQEVKLIDGMKIRFSNEEFRFCLEK